MFTPAQTTFIWDFDNTLYDTRRFWRENLFPAFLDLGIDVLTTEQLFKIATGGQDGNPDYFVPSNLARVLHEGNGADELDLLNVIERVVYSNAARAYFFDGALESVDYAKQKGYRNILLSYGDPDFKHRWFESLGVYEYFSLDDVKITTIKKPEMIKSLPLHEVVTVVNDVLAETKQIVDVLSQAGYIVAGYHFVEKPEDFTDEPSEEHITNFSDFKTIRNAL